YPRLCGSAEGIAALSELGVDAVTLANNHALDSDREGLRLTAERLSARGIVALGVRAAEQGTLRAERLGPIAVVAANATRTRYEPGRSVPLATPRAIERAVGEARRSEARRPVIVSIHAGREGWRWASRHDGELARAAVAGGAAAVVFHGAHVVRELRVERGVPVHLGLGNLLFDQRAPAMREGVVLTLRVPLRGGPAAVEGVTRVRAARDHE
ncbi:MAG: CapA family protein, partial [Deltaproteobacteria bacterium]|nr:CapA family protein [Deltaproteobacteria bacterium]